MEQDSKAAIRSETHTRVRNARIQVITFLLAETVKKQNFA